MQCFHKKHMSSFGGDAITVKIKDGCRRPYLSIDRPIFRADTTRPLAEHLKTSFKTIRPVVSEEM